VAEAIKFPLLTYTKFNPATGEATNITILPKVSDYFNLPSCVGCIFHKDVKGCNRFRDSLANSVNTETRKLHLCHLNGLVFTEFHETGLEPQKPNSIPCQPFKYI